MVQQLFSHVFNKKTLIPVAFTVLSLGGLAQAQSVSRTDTTATGNAHTTPAPQPGDYNFQAGGSD